MNLIRFTITGIESEHDLMSSRFGSYGEMNSGWTGDDVKGFAKIFGNQTAIFHKNQRSWKSYKMKKIRIGITEAERGIPVVN
ncbi:MAG: hypothetical protein WDM78_22690 [Puia sp.]